MPSGMGPYDLMASRGRAPTILVTGMRRLIILPVEDQIASLYSDDAYEFEHRSRRDGIHLRAKGQTAELRVWAGARILIGWFVSYRIEKGQRLNVRRRWLPW